MLNNLLVWITLLYLAVPSVGQTIREVQYLDRPHFKIVTKSAVYLYDLRGGGFSSIRDREGIEWVGYQPGEGKVPESAGADFRGMPNLVFGGQENGAGHPGFDQCISHKTARNKILTETKTGKWIWEWTFDKKGALLEVIQADSTRNYWFLYEGIPGGSFNTTQKYWGNDLDGIRYDTPPLETDSTASGNWNWAFFGDQKKERALVIVHLNPDQHEDNFSYMGNSKSGINAEDGMVVFGFGRTGSTPLLNDVNNFYITFLEVGNDIESQILRFVRNYNPD